MSAPNIVGVTTIIGITTMVSLTTTSSTIIVSNPASSNSVYKINTILAANIDGVNPVDLTVSITNQAAGAGTSFPIVNTVNIPADSTLVVLGKDSPIYLEENRSIVAIASSINDANIICSYEQIS